MQANDIKRQQTNQAKQNRLRAAFAYKESVVDKASKKGEKVGTVYVEVTGLSEVKEMFEKLEGYLDAARDLIEQMEDVELGVVAHGKRPR